MWSTAGGLFASIGATVVVMMNMVEHIQKGLGCWSGGKKLKARLETDDDSKKKKGGKQAAPMANPAKREQHDDEDKGDGEAAEAAPSSLADFDAPDAEALKLLSFTKKRRKSRLISEATAVPDTADAGKHSAQGMRVTASTVRLCEICSPSAMRLSRVAHSKAKLLLFLKFKTQL